MNRETVFLPPPRAMEEPEVEEPKPLPEEPPKICGGTDADVTLHGAVPEEKDWMTRAHRPRSQMNVNRP